MPLGSLAWRPSRIRRLTRTLGALCVFSSFIENAKFARSTGTKAGPKRQSRTTSTDDSQWILWPFRYSFSYSIVLCLHRAAKALSFVFHSMLVCMKRFFQLFLVAATVSFATSCSDKTAQEGNSAANADSIAAKVDSVASPKVASVDSATLVQRAKEILQFAAKKEYAKIADYIHPTKGIRFSPYTYVDTAEHKHFTAAEFREQVEKNAKKKVLWGTSDPLGEDILLTVEGYFKEFGYDKKVLGRRFLWLQSSHRQQYGDQQHRRNFPWRHLRGGLLGPQR